MKPFLLLLALCCLARGIAYGKAEHVVVVVWDGMRPDCITDEHTPALARLAREGVNFTRHHSIYPSSTEVNGTAMATGCYPGRSGLIGNRMYIPAINALAPVATEDMDTIRKGDKATSGKYLAVPTLAEAMHAAGWRTVVVGTKQVVLLQDRAERPENGDFATESILLHAGHTLPHAARKTLEETMGGPFPATVQLPNVVADGWTTRALIEVFWKNGPPKWSMLWLSDPDFTQHQFGPNAPASLRALASSDANLAKVLAALDAGGWRDKTDVFVVSDHGFSTVANPFDIRDTLVKAGFPASNGWKTSPQPGDVLVCGLGGSIYFYVAGHDEAMIQRLVDFLQKSPFAAVIFTKEARPGTFALSAIHLDTLNAPDIAVALRWTDRNNLNGSPGQIFSDGRKEGQGTHASLSPYDVHNTLVAAGPDFKAGYRDELPTSNIDLAPTIAHILGLPNPPPMDGRVLAEALVDEAKDEQAAPVTERLEAKREEGDFRWRQYLQTTRYGGVTYFDEGNVVDPR